jgi:hypothetical protein
MGSGLDDWIYWHDLTITVSYNSSQSKTCFIPYRTTSVCSSTATNHCSHIELLNELDSCLTNALESESYVTTDGQSASLSWYKAPIRGLRPDFYVRTEYGIRLTVTFLIPWGALSDERTGLSFVCAAGPCQRSLFRS